MLIATIKENGKIEALVQQDNESTSDFIARTFSYTRYDGDKVNFYMGSKIDIPPISINEGGNEGGEVK